MSITIGELIQYRDLLLSWTIREVKVRYKQSILGAGWAILQPLSGTIIFTIVFSKFVHVPTDGVPYPIFYYSALLPWTLFAASISSGVPSLLNNMSLVTKIYFPREILPLASIFACVFDFFIASLIFVGMIIFYKIQLTLSFICIPLILFIQFILMVGIILLGSAITVFYRDVRFIVPLGLQLWMYMCPIIYPLSRVPERFHFCYMLNPMAGVIDSYRRVLLHGQWPQLRYLLLAGLVAGVLLLGAYPYFKRAERVFADII